MEDALPCEVIKCELREVGLLPEPDSILPDELCNNSGKYEEVVLPDFSTEAADLRDPALKLEKDEEEEGDNLLVEVQEIKGKHEPTAACVSEDLKLSAEPVGMFEFVGLQTSSEDEGGTHEVASEMNMIRKMKANIVKALCVNTSSNVSKLSDPKPVIGNELVSRMKMAINTIIGREENGEGSDEGSSGEDASQLSPKLYFCEKCCKFFNQKSSLKKHSLTHLLKYTCAACNMSFQKKCNLRNHVIHTVCGLPFKCNTCGLAFKCKSKLVKHENAHADGEFWCAGCSKTFKYEQSFCKHKSVCQDSSLKCVVCRKTYSRPEAFKAHIAIHVTSEKPFGCDACGKRFMSESFYRRHTMILCGKVINKCDTCGKVFEELGELKKHSLTHKAMNMFTCERCSMTFQDREALKLHAQKYINEDGYKCERCHKLFLFKSELLTHKMRHSSYRTFSCNRCCATFTYEGSFKAHMILHSHEPHICGKCGMQFQTDDALKQHKLTHFETFNCQLCEKIFYQESKFRIHLHEHSKEAPLTCTMCGRTFKNKSALTSHAVVHGLKRRYTCFICSRVFIYRNSLRRHMFLAHRKFKL